MKRIGILALQGAFAAHRSALTAAGADAVEVRSAAELSSLDGLVIPGGESTTMLKLLASEGLLEPLRQFGESKPIFGTCRSGAACSRGKQSRPKLARTRRYHHRAQRLRAAIG